jgi:hypothetical protein
MSPTLNGRKYVGYCNFGTDHDHVHELAWNQHYAACYLIRSKGFNDHFHHFVSLSGWVESRVVQNGHGQPAPTSAPSRMDDMCSGNSLLLGCSSRANHGGVVRLAQLVYLLPTN